MKAGDLAFHIRQLQIRVKLPETVGDRGGTEPRSARVSQWSLQGRVAVVTGAARGLGAELARQLTERGARVALVGLEVDELEKLAAGLPGAAAFGGDVTDARAMDRIAAEVEERMGRASVVVINAGVAAAGPIEQSDPVAYDRVIEVNLLGSVRTVRAFLPHILATDGYILQIASMAALMAAPSMSAYCASKSGVEAMAHSLQVELSGRGAEVGIAYLSWIDTDMVRGVDAVPALREMRAGLPSPFNRTYGAVGAVARLVEGIERRRAHVWYPGWIRILVPVRGVTPYLNTRLLRRRARDTTPTLDLASGADGGGTGLLGAGGAAANQLAPLGHLAPERVGDSSPVPD
jgi:NAD(P)-dependent dehydrogenase (short-subunit alcohol dehydrogenase family)